MKNCNVELVINKLIKFMQHEIEDNGVVVNSCIFNFSKQFTQYYLFNHEPEVIAEGEDLTKFKDISGANDESIFKAINILLIRKFATRSMSYGNLPSAHFCSENSKFILLTEFGYFSARNVDNNILYKSHFVEEVDSQDKYISEKRKGGKNSYQAYKPLRDKVEDLCKEELNKKHYSSASQLRDKVAYIIEKKHPELLTSFQPYQNHKFKGNDWKMPTFYNWCKDSYNVFKTSPDFQTA